LATIVLVYGVYLASPASAGEAKSWVPISIMKHDEWFDSLIMCNLRMHHLWLGNIPSRIDKIVNFGCWSGGEPFALLWTLNANEVVVVEIEEKFIEEFRKQIEIVKHRYPESIHNRSIKYICRDMTETLSELPDQCYDLAYCEDVLYTIPLNRDMNALDRGINQMIRVVKSNGYIIAVEPKFGAKFEKRKVSNFGIEISIPVPITSPDDMNALFTSRGLRSINITNSPPYAYCYQKISE
jgi:SAM-dependent methyltransferase